MGLSLRLNFLTYKCEYIYTWWAKTCLTTVVKCSTIHVGPSCTKPPTQNGIHSSDDCCAFSAAVTRRRYTMEDWYMVWRVWQEIDCRWTSVEQVRDITSNACRYASVVSSSRVVSWYCGILYFHNISSSCWVDFGKCCMCECSSCLSLLINCTSFHSYWFFHVLILSIIT